MRRNVHTGQQLSARGIGTTYSKSIVIRHLRNLASKPYKPLFEPYTDPETLNAGNGKGFRV